MRVIVRNLLVFVVVWGVAAAFFALNAAAPHMARNVAPTVASKLWHLALFGVFWFAVFVAGRGAARLLKLTVAGAPPELAATLGIITFVYGAFVLGALHLAYGWLVKVLVASIAVSGAVVLRRGLAGVPARLRRWLGELDVSTAGLLAVSAAVILPTALTAAEPPFYWDALTYHLAVPQAYAAAHGFTYLPYNVYASMPMGGGLFYLIPLLWDGLITANASYFVVSLLAVAVTYRLARLWLGQFYAAVAAAFVLFTPMFLSCMAGAHTDHFQILFGAAALYVYFAGEREEGINRRRRVLAMGVFLGATLAVKYTAVAVAAAFAPVWVYDVARKRLRPGELAPALVVAAAFLAPWLVKAYIERGNPVFPLLYGVFGGRDFTAEQAQRFIAWQRSIGMGRGIVDYVLLPYRVSVNADSEYAKFMGVYLPFLLPLAALGAYFFRKAGRLAAFGWVFVFAWGLGSQQLRFLGSALPALGPAAAAALAAGDRWPRVWAGRLYRAALVVAFFGAGVTFYGGAILNSLRDHWYLVGQKQADFLRTICSFYPADEFINKELPADAKVLMVFTNHTLYLERPAVYDSFLEASAFLLAAEKARDGADLYRLARRWGVTHVLVHRGYEAKTWPYYKARARQNFDDFIRRFGVQLYGDGANDVYELVGEAP